MSGKVGSALLAGLAYLLLLDAAIETFWSGSPIRWWVTPPVLAFVVLSVALWRPGGWLGARSGWRGSASASSLTLLLLFLATAWLPNGQIDGVRMLLQPTSTLLSVGTAIAVALGLWVLLSAVRFLPATPRLAARIVLAALAAYALIALVVGVRDSTAYAMLFHGGAAWQRLPSWLQGTVVGVLGLLPLAIVGQVVRFVDHRRRNAPVPVLLQQTMVMAAALAIALSALSAGSPAPVIARGPGSNPSLVSTLPLPVERTFDLDHVRHESFAAALENAPEKIFAFVRDAIAFETYPGALRGPRGTLLGLAGNAVDRALLLASMLEASGQPVRFAHGTLPEGLARELVDSMWAGRPAGALEPKGGATPAAPTGTPRVFETSVKYNYRLIRDELERAGIRAGAEAATDMSALVREAQDHVWVQWQRGNEWIDLDPSFGDGVVGRTYAPVADTWSAIPDALYHRIELRVVLEEQSGDKVSTREVLTKTARASDLSGRDVLLGYQPEDWDGPASDLDETLSGALGSKRGGIKPVLIVGGEEMTVGESFYQRPPQPQTGGIGSFSGGASLQNTVAIATAGRIVMSFIAPDGRRVDVTRELFDLLGPARRLSEEPLTAAEALTKTEAVDAFDATVAVYDLFITTGRIAARHLSNVTAAETNDGDLAACLRRFGLSFAIASDALFEDLRAKGIRAYPDMPRVFIAEASGPETAPRLSLDLRHDRARIVARDSTPGKTFNARVLRGVLDGVLERILFEDLLTPAGEETQAGAPTPQPALSTSLLFEFAAQSAILPRLVTSAEGLDPLGLEADARARLHLELAQGFLALVPEQAVSLLGRRRAAWWRINVRSGDAVAVTDEGLHQVMVERRVVEDKNTHVVTITERKWYYNRYTGARTFLGQTQRTLSPRQFLQWVDRILEQEGSLGWWI